MDFKQVTDMCQMFVDLANCVERKHFGNEPYRCKVNEHANWCIIMRYDKSAFLFHFYDGAIHLVDNTDDDDYVQFNNIEEFTHFLFVWTSVIPVVYGYHY